MKNEPKRNEELTSADLEKIRGGAEAFPVADRARWRLRDGGTTTPDDHEPNPGKVALADEELSSAGTTPI